MQSGTRRTMQGGSRRTLHGESPCHLVTLLPRRLATLSPCCPVARRFTITAQHAKHLALSPFHPVALSIYDHGAHFALPLAQNWERGPGGEGDTGAHFQSGSRRTPRHPLPKRITAHTPTLTSKADHHRIFPLYQNWERGQGVRATPAHTFHRLGVDYAKQHQERASELVGLQPRRGERPTIGRFKPRAPRTTPKRDSAFEQRNRWCSIRHCDHIPLPKIGWLR